MVKLLPYDPCVKIQWATPNPLYQICNAAANTMKGIFAKEQVVSTKIPSFLYRANHGSPLEHAVISFELTQISRACLDQLVRHRMGSFTSSSQHYQDHRDYPMRMSHKLIESYRAVKPAVGYMMNEAILGYSYLIDEGVQKEEARMLLPMSTEVRVIWTVNARSLANFINLRTCRRNVMEMLLLATRVRKQAQEWFPELFDDVGPDCTQPWVLCRQGKMQCDFFNRNEEMKLYDKDEQR